MRRNCIETVKCNETELKPRNVQKLYIETKKCTETELKPRNVKKLN